MLVNGIAPLRPPDQRKHGLAELFPIVCKGIFHPGRNLSERFPVDQVFLPEIFEHIGQCLGTDPVEPLRDISKPDLLVVADDADDQDRPFFGNGIDDAFERAQADMVTIVFHSHFKTINWTPLILPN
jgi:hypothetical protein